MAGVRFSSGESGLCDWSVWGEEFSASFEADRHPPGAEMFVSDLRKEFYDVIVHEVRRGVQVCT